MINFIIVMIVIVSALPIGFFFGWVQRGKADMMRQYKREIKKMEIEHRKRQIERMKMLKKAEEIIDREMQ